MKVLVTGATGFVGRNLAEQYAQRHEVAAPGRAELDLMDADAVRSYLERQRFDVVIHAATCRSTRQTGSGAELLDANCRMFFHLARNAQAFGRMLFLSSGAVYDREHWRARMEEEYFDRYVPGDAYGFSKYLCAKAVDGMERVHELRLFGVFGPHEDWRVRFISNACARAVWDLPVVMRQNVYFDYLDVADLGRVLERMLAMPLGHRHYNVCTGRAMDLQTLGAMVIAASGKRLELVVKNEGLGNEYSGTNARLLAELGEFRFTEMRDSIGRLYAWYAERKQSIDPEALRFDG